MSKFLEGLIGQLAALVAFFAFPALQYMSLKRLTSGEGATNLSFSSTYGFRVAAANQLGKRVISDIRYRSLVRRLIKSPDNPRLALSDDFELHSRRDFFLFPGGDQILAAFKLRKEGDKIMFISTSVTGEERKSVLVNGDTHLVCDFTATVA